MIVVLDIETDSLDATVVHCIVAKDRQTGKVYSWKEQECYTDFPLFCSKVDKFIMHNGISFDAPVLNKLLGTKITLSQLEDTLILELFKYAPFPFSAENISFLIGSKIIPETIALPISDEPP